MKAKDLWKCDGRTTEKYVASPCAGHEGKVEVGHIYQIDDCSGNEEIKIGMMTLEEAYQSFSEKNIFVSDSHTICTDCWSVKLKGVKKKFRKK